VSRIFQFSEINARFSVSPKGFRNTWEGILIQSWGLETLPEEVAFKLRPDAQVEIPWRRGLYFKPERDRLYFFYFRKVSSRL
jgi:hypothetical protein